MFFIILPTIRRIVAYHVIDLLLRQPVFKQRPDTATHTFNWMGHSHLPEVCRYDAVFRGYTGEPRKLLVAHPFKVW